MAELKRPEFTDEELGILARGAFALLEGYISDSDSDVFFALGNRINDYLLRAEKNRQPSPEGNLPDAK